MYNTQRSGAQLAHALQLEVGVDVRGGGRPRREEHDTLRGVVGDHVPYTLTLHVPQLVR